MATRETFAPPSATSPMGGGTLGTFAPPPATGLTGTGNFADPWGGFASRYAPAYADQLLSNPSNIFYDTATQMGLAPTGPYGSFAAVENLAPYSDAAMLQYAMSQFGNPNILSPENQVNAFSQFGQQMLTPGGAAPSPQGMLSFLYSDPNFQQTFLNAGNEAQQVNALQDFMGVIGGLSHNPLLQRGIQNLLDQASYRYLSAASQGQNPGAFAPWFAQQYGPIMPGLTGGAGF